MIKYQYNKAQQSPEKMNYESIYCLQSKSGYAVVVFSVIIYIFTMLQHIMLAGIVYL